MSNTNLNKILANRVKLMLDFFFRVKRWSVLIFFILFAVSALAAGLTVKFSVVHIILGCVTAIFFLLFLIRF